MKTKFITKFIILLLLCSSMISCTEPYQMKTNTFEDALVVEATITNELKKQQIKLSRTYRFEENGPTFESGAIVYITDGAGNQYDFAEQNGIYESNQEFQAIPGKEYQLFIVTDDGKEYTSTIQRLTTINEIQDVTATVETIDGKRGVNIKAHSFDPTNSSKYYRYEYEETYKIIAPYWTGFKMVTVGPEAISLVPRTTEARVCYSTLNSKDIILTSTSDLSEDRVDFPVHFISDKDPIITHRYSILVKQHVQNIESYTYYKTLKKISGSQNGGILSPSQPGFFSGNIRSVNNSNEKVIGYFEVSATSSKRIFFNYSDLFPGETKPKYFVNCPQDTLRNCYNSQIPECAGWMLITYANIGNPIYYSNLDLDYVVVPAPCGDCTSFSSNIIPPFWQ